MHSHDTTFCVESSLLNPAKPFMDLWYHANYRFSDYKLHLVPFEDQHKGILSEIDHMLLTIECWQEVHPGLVTIPVNRDYSIPHGLLYRLEPSEDVFQFVKPAEAMTHMTNDDRSALVR